jgi:hypothetical protein
MEQMIIVEPFELTHQAVPGYTISRGATPENLVTPDPREVWVDTGAIGDYIIQIDFGVAVDWDTIALINITALPTAIWNISGGATSGQVLYQANQAMRMASEDGISATGPALYWSPTIKNGRYITLIINAGGPPINSIGGLVIGKSWKPTQPREQGAGRPPQDSGVRTRLDNGGLATVPGSLLSGFKWVFGDLDQADLKRLWGIFRRRRTTEPMLLVEAPDEGYAEGLHYGTFVDLEAYERLDTSKSRWAMVFEDWV